MPRVHIQVAHQGIQSQGYQLNQSEILMGRSPKADVVLPGAHVSRSHARLEFANGRWRLRDCNSVNGVYLDRGGKGSPFLARGDVVVSGDHLYIGQYRLAILEEDDAQAPVGAAGTPTAHATGLSGHETTETTVTVKRGMLKEELRHVMERTPVALDPVTPG